MLECTWNDKEAETAMRRLMLKEQKEQQLLASDPKLRKKVRDSALSRLTLKRVAGAAGAGNTF